MEPQDAAQMVIAEVEALTGCPVSVSQDATLRTMAVLDVARGPVRLHRIRIHPNFRNEVDYLTCFECGFILRKFAVPPERRSDFAANPKGKQDVEKLVRDHHSGKRLPPELLRGLSDQLYNGLMAQMVSIPLSLRVDSWIAASYTELADQQKVMIGLQLQDALGSMQPETKKIAPIQVVTPSLTMNAAYALFWSRRWSDPRGQRGPQPGARPIWCGESFGEELRRDVPLRLPRRAMGSLPAQAQREPGHRRRRGVAREADVAAVGIMNDLVGPG